MCFSASASFGAGVVLTTIGVVTLKKSNDRSQTAFAAIPLIFGIQQLAEGFLWLSLSDSDFTVLHEPMTYLFLLIAQVVWPFWVPFSMLRLEKNEKRKIVLKVLLGIATLLSAGLAFYLFAYPVEGKVDGCHIVYDQNYPQNFRIPGIILYVVSTIVPLFVSSVRRMWLLAITIAISYIATVIFYEGYVLSVWCFFAALISIMVFFLIPKRVS